MITEDYVNFEMAELLKEKGFDEECIGYYVDYEPNDIKYSFCGETNSIWESRCCSAPTLQMAMKWLREVHKLAINVEFQIDCPTWKWRIYHIEPLKGKYTNFKHYDTYEETCIEAIKYALENLI